jgi:hypothetical protein
MHVYLKSVLIILSTLFSRCACLKGMFISLSTLSIKRHACSYFVLLCNISIPLVCRWLPKNHRFRRDKDFGSYKGKDPPDARNAAECVAQGKASDTHQGAKNAHPKGTTGINRSCPLSHLHLFNIVWDICPDMMHIVKNFFEKISFKLFSGARVPEWDASKNVVPAKGAANYAEAKLRHQEAVARWKLAVVQNNACIFSKSDQELVDRRVKNLVGPAKWIKGSMVCDDDDDILCLVLHISILFFIPLPFSYTYV